MPVRERSAASLRSDGSSATPDSFLLSTMKLGNSYEELAELREEVEPWLRPGPLDEKDNVIGEEVKSAEPSGEDRCERNEPGGLFFARVLSKDTVELPAATS